MQHHSAKKKRTSSLNMAEQLDAHERILQQRSCRGVAEQVWCQTHHGRRLRFLGGPVAKITVAIRC